MSRRLRHLVPLAPLALLTACSATSPLPASGAVDRYDTVGEDVATTLAAADSTDVTWSLTETTRTVTEVGGTCSYTPGTWTPSSALAEPSDDDAWQGRIDALNPVLEESGFETLDRPAADGSRTVLTSEDTHGATLTITAEGEVRIHGATVDADPCTTKTLGIG
ncbi:hypothetical protein ACT3TZ_13070 [Brachybacterium sp. AOP25-B2-12]|uniref:hypothetical protein n=1 Tax=Brachybacterium sp. AOP25-B2-12 TaxID=3457710 RepID=UPI0040346218